jgi:genome maintenance exonuclease 1
MHAIAENYLEGNMEYFRQNSRKLPPESITMWRQIQPLIDTHISELYGTEIPLYSDSVQVAGRVDCIARCDGIPTIVDFKNSRKPKRAEWIEDYFIQITGYAIMHFDLTGIMIPEGRIWIAVEGQQAAQEFRFRTAQYIPQFMERRAAYRQKFGR